MYLSIINVKALKDYKLLLKFENDEERIFDITPYLEIGKFQELKDEQLLKLCEFHLILSSRTMNLT
jgi:hypothetical protein